MAGPLQYGYDTNYKPQGMLAGWLAGERDNELGLSRLMQQYSAAQELEDQKYKNQITQASVPAKQSEFLLQTLMNDTARNTPDYAQTMTQGTIDEARNKGELYKKSKVANEETAKDIKEQETLDKFANTIQILKANPRTPVAGAQAVEALMSLGLDIQSAEEVVAAGESQGIELGDILAKFHDSYIDYKAKTPRYAEKSMLLEQKDAAEMARVKAKVTSAENIARIKAVVQQAVAKAKTSNMSVDQLIAKDLQEIYPNARERIYAAQMAQQFKGEVTKYSNSGMVINTDEQGNKVIGQPTAPSPNLGTIPKVPFQGIPEASTSVPGTPPPTAAGSPSDQQAALLTAIKEAGWQYEPDKYHYGINPNTGNFGRYPKK